MDLLKINPIQCLNGEINAPSSKSYSHRAFIAASLADGVSVIKNPLISGDVKVTIDVLKTLGIKILEESKNSFIIEKVEDSFKPIKESIDCKNSGTTLRIFSALSLFIEGGLSFTGEFLKRDRPIVPLLEALKNLGGEYKLKQEFIHIKRTTNICNTVKIQGDISSQFITALLIASTKLKCIKKNAIEIEITTPLVSYPYIKITLDVLNSFGITILEKLNEKKTGKYVVRCGQKYRPQNYEIPGDFSSAAFIIAAAVLSPKDSKVIIKNLDIRNPQGDKKIVEILKRMGANIEVNPNEIIVIGNLVKNPLNGIKIDCSDIPDLFPILSVVGAFAMGKTTLYNASNLRLKECDRISVMARELSKMGIKISEKEDELTIYHSDLKGSTINHESDHRIAMACIIAALYSNSISMINNAQIIKDSYPNFIDDLAMLGASIDLQI